MSRLSKHPVGWLVAGAVVALAGARLDPLPAAMAANEPAAPTELPVRMIPNIPEAAEAYYAPDNLHVIAQTQDAAAQHAGEGRASARPPAAKSPRSRLPQW